MFVCSKQLKCASLRSNKHPELVTYCKIFLSSSCGHVLLLSPSPFSFQCFSNQSRFTANFMFSLPVVESLLTCKTRGRSARTRERTKSQTRLSSRTSPAKSSNRSELQHKYTVVVCKIKNRIFMLLPSFQKYFKLFSSCCCCNTQFLCLELQF